MTFKTIKIETAAHITTCTFKRSNKSNSITAEFMEEFADVLEQISQSTETRCLIITANGRAFCSGLDVQELERMSTTPSSEALDVLLRQWQAAFDKLENLPQLTIAAINGPVSGAGLEMILACDFRIASTRAFFGMPQVQQGILPDLGGIRRLNRTVGPAWSKEIIFRGRNFNSMEALRVGLVNRVSEPGDLIGTAQKWAAQFATLPPAAARTAKELINASVDMAAASADSLVRESQLKLVQTEEFRLALVALGEQATVEE